MAVATAKTVQAELERLKALLATLPNTLDDSSRELDKMNLARFLAEEFLPAVAAIEGQLLDAPHLEKWAEAVERHRFVALIAFRGSAKSTFLKAVVAHALREHKRGAFDAVYYSAKLDLARWHLRRLKLYLRDLAAKWGWRDATQGEALLRYERPGAVFTCDPEGLDAASRGRRADLLVIDDPLDPRKLASLADIDRVLDALQRRVLPLLKDASARVLVAATPIIRGDVADWVEQNSEFVVLRLPAIREDGSPAWPQKFPLGELERLKALMGEKAFRCEFLLEPAGATDSYLDPNVIDSAIYTPEEESHAGT